MTAAAAIYRSHEKELPMAQQAVPYVIAIIAVFMVFVVGVGAVQISSWLPDRKRA